ncbi:MATE family efflux transporter [Pannonibacter tanglangensis]|uniref:MATE family efflux transporter n=1 Tax=Pannonibacter tanglangensis TaxID=2750084 RepID=A0ABW9ZDG1_9HYPH|nr:MATE family efflux transporter [Pannonibacter sp. XCT-34]NBN62469.1 MATE family efflux transporter [Pannonibacter sp. XCT-34]
MDSTRLSRTFLIYTLPSVAALLVHALNMMIDGIFIGQVMGTPGLSGIYMAWPLVGVVLAVGTMIGIGGGAQLSMANGAGRSALARRYLAQSLVLVVVCGLAGGLFLILCRGWFLAFQGAPDAVVAHGMEYLFVRGLGGVSVMGAAVLPLLVRNTGAPIRATLAMFAGVLVNLVLDYLFIVEFGWGLAGAAAATVAGEVTSDLACLWILFSSRTALRPAPADFRIRPRRMARILVTGFTSMIMYLYMSVVIMLHNFLFMRHGSEVQVAAFAITDYYMAFYYLLAEGICGGMQPLVSHFHGAGARKAVLGALRLAMITIFGLGCALVGALLLVPEVFVALFTTGDPVLAAAAAHGIRLHLFTMMLEGLIIIVATYFQAIGDARRALSIAIANMLVQLPFLAILPRFYGTDGIWLAIPAANLVLTPVVLAMLALHLRREARRTVAPA